MRACSRDSDPGSVLSLSRITASKGAQRINQSCVYRRSIPGCRSIDAGSWIDSRHTRPKSIGLDLSRSIQRGEVMSEINSKHYFLPVGWNTVTARIVAHQAHQLVEFVKYVFGATGEYQSDRPAIVTIGDSMIMISDAGAREPIAAFLYVYVADADETYQRAVNSGAISLEEPTNTLYGDRRGMIKDAWGNIWQIATHNPSQQLDTKS